MLHRLDQLRENISAALDNFRQLIQCAFAIGAVTTFELFQPVHLELLLCAWRADDFHVGQRVVGVVAVEPNDGPRAIVDLLLVAMCRGLNLAALVAKFRGREHAAEVMELVEFVKDRGFDGALDDFHAG